MCRIIKDFNQNWKFKRGKDPNRCSPVFDDSRWKEVNLPHDYRIESSYNKDLASSMAFLPGGVGWYRKYFKVPQEDKGKKIFVHFDGVYKDSKVWINGSLVGERPSGYLSFRYDLTPHINYGDEKNLIAVRVNHPEMTDSRWYTGSGIYRNVKLIKTNKVHVAKWGVSVNTNVKENIAELSIKVKIKNDRDEKAKINLVNSVKNELEEIKATAEDETVIPPGSQKEVLQEVAVENPRLWSPKSPNIYKLRTEIEEEGDPIDTCDTIFGIRDFTFDPDEGFSLNGENINLKGVCLHHDAGNLGAAVPERVWERRLEILKESGCNAIRTAHNPPDPVLLDLCDKMGFLVMDEAFDEWRKPKKKWVEGWNEGEPKYHGYAEYFDEWAERDIKDMVMRDRNHPSVIIWSIGNEIDYPNDPYSHPILEEGYRPEKPCSKKLTSIAQNLSEAVKSIDTTRPVTAALADLKISNEIGLPEVLDIVGYNYQESRYSEDHEEFPERIIYGSENSAGLSEWLAVELNQYISGQFLWTGIDYLGECSRWPFRAFNKSLLDLAGFKKPSYYFMKSLWADEPMVHLTTRVPDDPESSDLDPQMHWNWTGKEDEEIFVLCYSNCESVELKLNGDSLGEKSKSDFPDRILKWEVLYEPGVLEAIGKVNDQKTCVHKLETAGKPEKLRLEVDKDVLVSDGKDVAHVLVKITDKKGNRVPFATNKISCKLKGPGEIIGLENGNPKIPENLGGNKRRAFKGKLLIYVQSKVNQEGKINVEASSPSLGSDSIEIRSELEKSI